MTTVADALDYLALGWSVIPIHDGTKDPAVRSWMPFQTERPDAKKLRGWFHQSGQRNIAVVLGPVSGNLVCRDFDKLESYHTWAAVLSSCGNVDRLMKVNRGVAHRWLFLFLTDGLLELV